MDSGTEIRGVALPIPKARPLVRRHTGIFVMAVVVLTLGFFLVWPVLLLLINSFNTAADWFVEPRRWGLAHWQAAFRHPRLIASIGNSFLIWSLVTAISFPIAVAIAWTLARTNIPFSQSLEFLFWVSFMMPDISTTLAWIGLMSPDIGLLNIALETLPFIEQGPFNIYSVAGIVWAHLMAHGIAIKVMLLTPAFRNMDAAMEEAARVGGATKLRTMLQVTLPLMISPMALVFALGLLRIFQSFEIEWLLGAPIGFQVYSTQIFSLIRSETTPNYGEATVLASMTLLLVAVIIPLQRWILQRRRYTTITGSFKPGLTDLSPWRIVIFGLVMFLLVLLTIGPAITLVFQSFMTRAGYFNLDPVFTLKHWHRVLTDGVFLNALRTTLILASIAAVASPLLFSLLAYLLVRTRLAGRGALDLIIWGSGAMPGMLTGLGLLWLFLGTPGLAILFGSIWALIIVVILQGNTTGTNIMKGVFVQIGADMEEAARISGAGWIRTYIRIWIPLLMPTLILIGTINFVLAAGATSSIILLAGRGTLTLSLLALEFAGADVGQWEEASITGLFIIAFTVIMATVARVFGLRFGIQHER
jgi:iron(III) transport system permease protein